MKTKDEALAQIEEEKIKEKQKEIRQMDRKLRMMVRKHALIEKKVEKMEGFGEFAKKVTRDYSD